MPELDVEATAPIVIEAVACAYATTTPGFAALADPRVARTYLDLGG